MGKAKKKPYTQSRLDEKSSKASSSRKRRLIIFVLTFLGLLIVGAIIYPHLSIVYAEELSGFMAITADICGGLLGIFSDTVTVSDRYMSCKGFTVEIIEECTGMFEMLIFLVALLSYPADWRSKLIGVILGLPVLYLFNVLRIAALTLVGVYSPGLFDFMHLYFWQGTLILMITTVWVLWILFVVNRYEKADALLS